MNRSLQFIGLYEIWGLGLPYIPNILYHVDATGWVSISNDSNQSWGGSFTDPTSTNNVPWGGSFDACPSPHGVWLVHTLTGVASTKIFFTTDVISVYGPSIIGFAGGDWTGTSSMVRHLNNFPSKITLLV